MVDITSERSSDHQPAGMPAGFGRLWLGSGLATAGAAVSEVALPLIAVLILDASTFAVSGLLAGSQAAWPVLGLLAGVWVDRWSRRAVLVRTQLGYAAVMASVPLAAAWGTLTYAHLVAVAVATGTLMVFTETARIAYVPAVVGKQGLVTANSRLTATDTALGLAGNSLAGVVVQAIGAPLALLIDAVTSFAAALGIRSVPVVDRPERADTRSVRAEAAEGLRYTFRNPVFRTLLLTAALLNAALAAQYALVVVLLSRTFALDPWLIGLLLASSGAGGLLGAAVIGRLTTRWPSGLVWRTALITVPVVALLVPASFPGAGLALFAAGMLGLNAAAVVFTVIGGSFRQALCPPRLLGRMSASSKVVAWGVIPLGSLAGGGLGTLLGVRPALWVVALATFAAPLFVRRSPLRDVDDLSDLEGLAAPGASDDAARGV